MDTDPLFSEACQLSRKGLHTEALILLKQIVASREDSRYLIAYGVCLQKLKHWKQSVAPLERGISLKPLYGEGDARLYLAEAYLMSGNKSKGLQQLKVVANMAPEYPSYEHVPDRAKELLTKHG